MSEIQKTTEKVMAKIMLRFFKLYPKELHANIQGVVQDFFRNRKLTEESFLELDSFVAKLVKNKLKNQEIPNEIIPDNKSVRS